MTFTSNLLFCPTSLTTLQRHPSDEWDNSWLSPEDQCKWEMENTTDDGMISSNMNSLHCGSMDCNESIRTSKNTPNKSNQNNDNTNGTTWSISQQVQLWFQSLVDSVDVACGTPEIYDPTRMTDGTKLDGYPMERFVSLHISPTKDDVQEFVTHGDFQKVTLGTCTTTSTTSTTGDELGGHTTRTYWDDESAI
jgi:hypothetical protein